MTEASEQDNYDVFVATRKVNTDSEPEWIRLDAPLADARAALRNLRDAGGNGLVVPSRYRNPVVSRADARTLAAESLRSVRESVPDRYSDLDDGEDEGACWIFCAENHTAQEHGLIPRRRSFRVDKLDGHIWSEPETAAFLVLSSI